MITEFIWGFYLIFVGAEYFLGSLDLNNQLSLGILLIGGLQLIITSYLAYRTKVISQQQIKLDKKPKIVAEVSEVYSDEIEIKLKTKQGSCHVTNIQVIASYILDNGEEKLDKHNKLQIKDHVSESNSFYLAPESSFHVRITAPEDFDVCRIDFLVYMREFRRDYVTLEIPENRAE